MLKKLAAFSACGLLLAPAALAEEAGERVTVDNFRTAETHFYMKRSVDMGCFAALCHDREVTKVDTQTVVAMNRDTLYSNGVFDLSEPLTLKMPDENGRFQSVMVISEDHYIQILPTGPSEVLITKEMTGSRYAMLVFRTFVDSDDPGDFPPAHELQDAITIEQASPGTFDIPNWNQGQRAEIRQLLIKLNAFNPSTQGRFGTKENTDPVRSSIATGAGWGGNPPEAAIYSAVTLPDNDGETAYTLTVSDVPVDGFWSITVYNSERFFEAPAELASVNNVTADKNADGSVTVHFGGDEAADNFLRIMPGWNYIVRLYRPRQEILDGTWTFPMPTPVQ